MRWFSRPTVVRAARDDRFPTVVCAWCKTTMRRGNHLVSHGMCEACLGQLAAGGLSDANRIERAAS